MSEPDRTISRRALLQRSSVGFGAVALSGLFGRAASACAKVRSVTSPTPSPEAVEASATAAPSAVAAAGSAGSIFGGGLAAS